MNMRSSSKPVDSQTVKDMPQTAGTFEMEICELSKQAGQMPPRPVYTKLVWISPDDMLHRLFGFCFSGMARGKKRAYAPGPPAPANREVLQ